MPWVAPTSYEERGISVQGLAKEKKSLSKLKWTVTIDDVHFSMFLSWVRGWLPSHDNVKVSPPRMVLCLSLWGQHRAVRSLQSRIWHLHLLKLLFSRNCAHCSWQHLSVLVPTCSEVGSSAKALYSLEQIQVGQICRNKCIYSIECLLLLKFPHMLLYLILLPTLCGRPCNYPFYMYIYLSYI